LSRLTPKKTIILDSISSSTVKKEHPWIFSKRIESKTKDLKSGDLVILLDMEGNRLGTGIFSGIDELIAIRIIEFGSDFSLERLYKKLISAIEKRLPLLVYTDSFRLIHGENDFFPGINVDYHAGNLILRYYSKSLYLFSRMILRAIWEIVWNNSEWKLRIENAYIQTPNRTGKSIINKDKDLRLVRGKRSEYIKIKYRNISYQIKPELQKGGIYNDIRNLRDYLWLHKNYVYDKRVLNLFSNNGLLSKCLINLGANSVVSLEDSRECIEVHKVNSRNDTKEIILKKNIFIEFQEFVDSTEKNYNLIIIDPPSLTSTSKEKPQAIKIYKKLIKLSLKILEKDGILILCSCSNRIHSNEFESISKNAFLESESKMKRLDKLSPELDHPEIKQFPEGQYFKVHIYKKL
jgi:23S rRNA G2069 N7-methylase RlmK/C1962 C5-methylase RlmI